MESVVIVFNEVMELTNERGRPCRARLSVVKEVKVKNNIFLETFPKAYKSNP